MSKLYCCDKLMLRVAIFSYWCGNCGSIRRWLCKGRISPNLCVCATCTRWGPERHGATMVCHNGAIEQQRHWTSAGYVCKKYNPRNPPTTIAGSIPFKRHWSEDIRKSRGEIVKWPRE